MKNINSRVSNQEVFMGVFLMLFDEFKNDYDTEDFEDILDGVDFNSLAQAITHKMQNVYSYTAKSNQRFMLEYQSKPLIKGNACMLFSVNESASISETLQEYSNELWITEDLEFVLINSFEVNYPPREIEYTTVYRTVTKFSPKGYDLPFSLDDLADELARLCEDVYEHKTPICEV